MVLYFFPFQIPKLSLFVSSMSSASTFVSGWRFTRVLNLREGWERKGMGNESVTVPWVALHAHWCVYFFRRNQYSALVQRQSIFRCPPESSRRWERSRGSGNLFPGFLTHLKLIISIIPFIYDFHDSYLFL